MRPVELSTNFSNASHTAVKPTQTRHRRWACRFRASSRPVHKRECKRRLRQTPRATQRGFLWIKNPHSRRVWQNSMILTLATIQNIQGHEAVGSSEQLSALLTKPPLRRRPLCRQLKKVKPELEIGTGKPTIRAALSDRETSA